MSSIPTTKLTIAQYLNEKIKASDKTEKQIATLIRHDEKSLQLILQGLMKLPVSLIAPLAEALEIDPGFLMMKVLREYSPDMLSAINSTLHLTALSRNEKRLIDAYRMVVQETDQRPLSLMESD